MSGGLMKRTTAGAMAAAASIGMTTAAQAEWQRAESTHYIVYGDMKPAEMRRAAEKFEKYTFVLRTLSHLQPTAATPTKLTVYMVHDMAQVQSTMPFGGGGVAGYYQAAVRGSILVTPPLGRADIMVGVARDRTAETDYDLVAYHELAHNFMYQNSSALHPTWYSEGFADFYGTFRLEETATTDRVEIGQPQYWRMQTMAAGDWIPAEKLLSAQNYGDVGESIYALYAQGWLLVHYAATHPERGKQVQRYLDGINAGQGYAAAAKSAFGGDLDRFNADLKAYSRSSRLNLISYPFKKIDPGKIDVRPMTPAEVALWRADLRLSSGVEQSAAVDFGRDVRRRAAPFANDGYAQSILAETEMALGNEIAAGEAAARWLAIEPREPLAMTYKAQADLAALKKARVPAGDPRWKESRRTLIAAVRLNDRDPRILNAYFDSFETEGVLPPPGAQNALMEALTRVPADDDLRMKVARDYERRGLIEDAITVIKPLAYRMKPASELSPRERAQRNKARKTYALLGEDPTSETARDVLIRLQKKLPAAAGTQAAATS